MIRNQLVFSRVFPLQATDPATPLEKITVTLPAVYDLSPLLEAFDLAPERTERKRSPQFQVPAYETEHAAGLAAWLREELANAVSKRDASGQRKCQLEDLTNLVIRRHRLQNLKVRTCKRRCKLRYRRHPAHLFRESSYV